jgi:hypothetical protein
MNKTFAENKTNMERRNDNNGVSRTFYDLIWMFVDLKTNNKILYFGKPKAIYLC